MSNKVTIIDYELGKVVLTPKTDEKKVNKVLKKRKVKIEDKKRIEKDADMRSKK